MSTLPGLKTGGNGTNIKGIKLGGHHHEDPYLSQIHVGNRMAAGQTAVYPRSGATTPVSSEGTEKVDNTVYIWYNVSIKYRRCFYDRTTAEIGAKSIHGNI